MFNNLKDKAKEIAADAAAKAKTIDISAIKGAAASVASKAKTLDMSAVKGAVASATDRAKSLTAASPQQRGDDGEKTIDVRIKDVATALYKVQASLGDVARELAAIGNLAANQPKLGKSGSRVLFVISGGNVQIASDVDADCQIYNFDDYESNGGGVPARFRDLAEELGVPVAEVPVPDGTL